MSRRDYNLQQLKKVEFKRMEILDEFDINIIKELEKDGRMAFSAIATNLKISNTMVHQRINRMIEQGVIGGIKPIIQEKTLATTGPLLPELH